MIHHLSDQDIQYFAMGMHDAIDIEEFRGHLKTCSDCSAKLSSEAKTELTIRAAAEQAKFCVACERNCQSKRCGHCGAATSVGDYRIESLINQNSRGRIYVASDSKGNQVALKELAFVQAPSAEDVASFEREASILRTLNHRGIPRFVASFREGEGTQTRFYLAQEYIAGDSLETRLEKQQFSEEDAYRISEEILEILIYLQSLSPMVFHRDIKPANLMYREDGSIVLVDFGAARNLGATASATLVGTFGYMPVEQLGGIVDATSDVYALGATLCHLLTRRDPWQLLEDRTILDRMNIGARLKEVISKMVAKERGQRYLNAQQTMDALHAPNNSLPSLHQRGISWNCLFPRPWRWATLALAATLTIAFAGYSAMKDTRPAGPVVVRTDLGNEVLDSAENFRLSVVSSPVGAKVQLDGKEIGVTPLKMTRIKRGVHSLTLSFPGYKAQSTSFTADPGEKLNLETNLEKINAEPTASQSFKIHSDPKHAELYIDGDFAGYTDDLLKVLGTPGYHDIAISATGYKTYTDVASLSPGQELEYWATLEKKVKGEADEEAMLRIQGTKEIHPFPEDAIQMNLIDKRVEATLRVCALHEGTVVSAKIQDIAHSSGYPNYDAKLEETVLANWRYAKRERGGCTQVTFIYIPGKSIPKTIPRYDSNERCSESDDPLCGL